MPEGNSTVMRMDSFLRYDWRFSSPRRREGRARLKGRFSNFPVECSLVPPLTRRDMCNQEGISYNLSNDRFSGDFNHESRSSNKGWSHLPWRENVKKPSSSVWKPRIRLPPHLSPSKKTSSMQRCTPVTVLPFRGRGKYAFGREAIPAIVCRQK